jgi:multiple sugar transport system substrate-binding protein
MKHMISRRSFLMSTAALTVTGVLAACGTAVDSGAGDMESADLSVWVWWPSPVPSLMEMGETFMDANPDVSVSVEAPSDYWTKIQTSIAGGAGPDLFFMNNVNYWSWAARGVLYDMTELAAFDYAMQDNIANSWKGAVDFYHYKGKQFGMPYMYTSIVLYYNVDYINSKGLALPADIEDEMDWNKFREYGLALHEAAEGSPSMWGLYSTGDIQTGWLNYVRANGGDFLNLDNSECIIDSPESIEAWNYLVNLRREDGISPSPEALQAEGANSLFQTGRIALYPSGNWEMSFLNEQLKDFAYDITLLPFSPQTGERGGTTNIVGVVINQNTPAKDASWNLMTHLLSKDSQDKLARANVLAPVRHDSAELYYNPDLGPPNRKAAFEMVQWTTALPTHEVVTWGEMMQPTTEWQTEIFEGRVSVEEGLKNMADSVNSLF